MSISILYLVHSTSTGNERHLATGWDHGELSPNGLRQAEELGDQVPESFDHIFVSDLHRAVQTASLAFGQRFPITKDARLREINYGDLTNKPGAEVKRNLKQHITQRFPNGESYSDVVARMGDFLSMLGSSYQGRRIAIVAHQAPQFAMEVLLKGKTLEEAIDNDWRLRKQWQPGWEYVLDGSYV